MKTLLMFVHDNEPLSKRTIRWHASGGMVSRQADEEGKIEVELEPGSYQFEIEDADRDTSMAQQVEIRESGAHLLVVQVGHVRGPNTEDGIYAQHIAKLGSRYSFDSVLGRGGMGVVIKAQDNILHRPVAIKFLNEELRDNAEAQQIFLTEARSLATLSHPNLVGVHDVATIEDNVVMISEFVEGKNLEEQLSAHGPMSQQAVVRIGVQLAEALSYMHEQGVIHRDIKPANMMVQEDGSLKIIDFGLARSLDEIAIKGTRLRGTPAYMAPEQLVGDTLTSALDLYQTGVTFYELLTKKLPFQGGDIAFAHVHREPDAIETHLPSLHPQLAALIMQCLAKDPAERPTNAGLLAQDLTYISSQLKGGATSELRSIASVGFTSGSLPHIESVAAPPTTYNTETMDVSKDEILLHTSTAARNPKQSKNLVPAMLAVLFLCIAAIVAIVLLWEKPPETTTTIDAPTTAAISPPAQNDPSPSLPSEPVKVPPEQEKTPPTSQKIAPPETPPTIAETEPKEGEKEAVNPKKTPKRVVRKNVAKTKRSPKKQTPPEPSTNTPENTVVSDKDPSSDTPPEDKVKPTTEPENPKVADKTEDKSEDKTASTKPKTRKVIRRIIRRTVKPKEKEEDEEKKKFIRGL